MDDSIKDVSVTDEEWLRRMEIELAKTHHHADGSPVHLRMEKRDSDRTAEKAAGKEDYNPNQAAPRALCDCGKEVRMGTKERGYSEEKASGGYSGKEHKSGYDGSPAAGYKS